MDDESPAQAIHRATVRILGTPVYLFIIGSVLAWIAMLIYIRGHGMEVFSNIFFFDCLDSFMDYFNSVYYSINNPYTSSDFLVIYPALITVVYSVIGYMTDGTVVEFGMTVAKNMRNSEVPMMVFFAITLCCVFLLQVLMVRKCEKQMGTTVSKLLFIVLLFSYPVLWTLERGNSILYAVISMMIFLNGYRSENRWIRYGAYVSLGFAAGVKIFPALLIILILRERRYREFLYCFAIIVAMFIVPFVFTDGTIFILLDSVLNYTDSSVLVNGRINIRDIFEYYGLPSLAATVTSFGLLALTILITLFNRTLPEWKILLLNCCAIMECFSVGVPYLTLYLMIPLILFLVTETRVTVMNAVYLAMFLIVFAMYPLNVEDYTVVASVRCMTAFAMYLLVTAEALLGGVVRKLMASESETMGETA